MAHRNFFPFVFITLLLFLALILGVVRSRPSNSVKKPDQSLSVPCIGSIQVLNGCGITGAADKVTDFLRSERFDVKNTGNAQTWNYPFTMVVSRITDMAIARQVAGVLKTDRCILLRNADSTYNVTVIVGPDFLERIP